MFLGEAAGSVEFKRYRGSQQPRLLPAKKESSASMLQAIRKIISARHAAASATRFLVPLSVALVVAAWQPAPEERFSRAQYYFAQMLKANGKVKQAASEYERLREVGALNTIRLNNLAWQYSLHGRGEAIDLAQQTHDMGPDNGSITDTQGWILFNAEETERAVDLLRQTVKQSPDRSQIQFYLAAALAETGETSAAKSIVDEVLASGASLSSRIQARQLVKTL